MLIPLFINYMENPCLYWVNDLWYTLNILKVREYVNSKYILVESPLSSPARPRIDSSESGHVSDKMSVLNSSFARERDGLR